MQLCKRRNGPTWTVAGPVFQGDGRRHGAVQGVVKVNDLEHEDTPFRQVQHSLKIHTKIRSYQNADP